METTSTFKARIGQQMLGIIEMETTYLGDDSGGKLTRNSFRMANKISDCIKKR